MATQRRFAVMGENLFKIVNKLITNQRVCRLLKYQNADPFDESLPDIDGIELINSSIVITPKYPEFDNIERSYIQVLFNNYSVNIANPDFKTATLRFDIVCPYTEWVLNSDNLRPYLLMQEVDTMFNQAKLSGLGNLQFLTSSPLALSPQMGGYQLIYQINEFN